MKVEWGNRRKKGQAQAMVEFALTLPIFLLLVLGIIEFSRLFMTYMAVYTASREAARYGSSVGVAPNGKTHDQDCEGMKQLAVEMGSFAGVKPEDVQIYYEKSPGIWKAACGATTTELGDRVVVEVQGRFQPAVPIDFTSLGIPFRFREVIVHAKSGRTILKEIKLRVTPLPAPNCASDVSISAWGMEGNKTVYINITNNSATDTAYKLEAIQNLRWASGSPTINLTTILWGTEQVFYNASGIPAPPLPGITIPSATYPWAPTENRNIIDGMTKTLKLTFDKNISSWKTGDISLQLKFVAVSDNRFQCTIGWVYQK